jgi:hypothetical protein
VDSLSSIVSGTPLCVDTVDASSVGVVRIKMRNKRVSGLAVRKSLD